MKLEAPKSSREIPAEEKSQNEQEGMTRRSFLRFAAIGAALIATEGCAPLRMAERASERADLLNRKELFTRKWKIVLEEGIKKLESNEALTKQWGKEGIKQVVDILRAFDIDAYVHTLASASGVAEKNIGGEILDLEIIPSLGDGTMAAVEDLRHMKIYLGEWARWQGSFHQPTLNATIKHELAHIFSFDYNARMAESVPIAYQEQTLGWQNKMYLGRALYEGSTEVVAMIAQLETGGPQSVEQGYRGGGTLSAYVLSELMGRKNFMRMYLEHSPELLKAAVVANVGSRGSILMQPLNAGEGIGNDFYDDSLDFLHRAFTTKGIERKTIAKILAKAKKEGVQERADHHDMHGLSITTHLFSINDADDARQYALNAAGQGPDVYRFGKPMSQGFPVKERLFFTLLSQKLTRETQNKVISNVAEKLRRRCETADPDSRALADAQLYIGIDDVIEKDLATMSALTDDEKSQSQIDKLWEKINAHAKELIAAAVADVYEGAGVGDLVVRS